MIKVLIFQAIQNYLGLPETPTNISNVCVSADTALLVGKIGAQPTFGLMADSGFQYQLLNRIPEESFQNIRPLLTVPNQFYQP